MPQAGDGEMAQARDSVAIALDGPAIGNGFLTLLADPRSVALMSGVCEEPLERDELIARVDFDGSAFDRAIRRLTDMGLIARMAMPEDNRRKGYCLAQCGRDLLAIDAALDAAVAGFDEEIDRAQLAKAISDPWDRAITRVVLKAPQSFGDLQRMALGAWRPTRAGQAAHLSDAALSRRLERLCGVRLVDCRPEAALYAPGENLWRLGRVAALAASWRWRWTPQDVPRMAGDLAGLVRMVAPRVRVPEGTEIRVVLHVIAPQGMEDWPEIVACVIDERMTLPELTLPVPDAHARATPPAWLQALLSGELDAIEIEGDSAAAHTVLSALADILSA